MSLFDVTFGRHLGISLLDVIFVYHFLDNIFGRCFWTSLLDATFEHHF